MSGAHRLVAWFQDLPPRRSLLLTIGAGGLVIGLLAAALIPSAAVLAEAHAYLAHLLLGARLKECVGLVNKTEGRSAHEIFGSPDDLKFHSSMTLFAAAAPQEPLFGEALHKYFADRRDLLTLAKL